eukprot:2598158-Pleurochrysis_carterae.AAC.1
MAHCSISGVPDKSRILHPRTDAYEAKTRRVKKKDEKPQKVKGPDQLAPAKCRSATRYEVRLGQKIP